MDYILIIILNSILKNNLKPKQQHMQIKSGTTANH